MCRSCSDGGRRCPRTEATRARERSASARYYKRGIARRKIALLAAAGVPAVTDTDMPTTYHQHTPEQPLDLTAGERELTNSESALPDKPDGALWTSPGRIDTDGKTKTAWTDWSALNSRTSHDASTLVEVKAQPGAVIACLNDPDDAQHLMDRYGTTDPLGNRAFDWEAMRRDDIDGVYVSDDMSRPGCPGGDSAAGNLYGWDATSVAWLSTSNLHAEGTREVGTYEYEDPDDEAGSLHRDVKIDDGFGQYDAPPRPDLATAWDRVPKRFREDEQPEPTEEPIEGPTGRGHVYRPAHQGHGPTHPQEAGMIDLGIAAVNLARQVGSEKAS